MLASVGGSALGPIVGGPIQKYLSWRWNFWVQLIVGGVVQLIHFATVPETRATVMLDREARRRRRAGETNIYGPNELRQGPRFTAKGLFKIWIRPFEMFVREPIVLCLSLLSGFSDALIFIFLESFTPVYKQWGFDPVSTGLAFIPIIVGYLLAILSFFPFIHRDRKIRRKDPDALQPERRLYWLLYMAPLETIGLFGFAWTSLGSPQVHWIAPMIFSALVGIANYAIYMATVDYMIASYGPYSASATGGNGFARDFLAGIAAMYSGPCKPPPLPSSSLSISGGFSGGFSSFFYGKWRAHTRMIRQSTTTLAATRSSTRPPSWPASPSSSRFRFTSSTGRAPPCAPGASSRRRWPVTSRSATRAGARPWRSRRRREEWWGIFGELWEVLYIWHVLTFHLFLSSERYCTYVTSSHAVVYFEAYSLGLSKF